MSRKYNYLITAGNNVLVGAFTSLAELKPYEERFNKTYKDGWDIIQVNDYPEEWIKADYHITDINCICHA